MMQWSLHYFALVARIYFEVAVAALTGFVRGIYRQINGVIDTINSVLSLVDRVMDFDLLNLPRPAPEAPWAYVKVAEGCDRTCGFCAIPSFRGPQRSRDPQSILDEVAGERADIVVVGHKQAGRWRRAICRLTKNPDIESFLKERLDCTVITVGL